jgi:hypothetical protein
MPYNEVKGVPLHYASEGDVWVADYCSGFGMMELVVAGNQEGADPDQIAAVERLADTMEDVIYRTHLRLGIRRFVWKPIRIVAIHKDNRVAIRFQHILTKSQAELLFVD